MAPSTLSFTVGVLFCVGAFVFRITFLAVIRGCEVLAFARGRPGPLLRAEDFPVTAFLAGFAVFRTGLVVAAEGSGRYAWRRAAWPVEPRVTAMNADVAGEGLAERWRG